MNTLEEFEQTILEELKNNIKAKNTEVTLAKPLNFAPNPVKQNFVTLDFCDATITPAGFAGLPDGDDTESEQKLLEVKLNVGLYFPKHSTPAERGDLLNSVCNVLLGKKSGGGVESVYCSTANYDGKTSAFVQSITAKACCILENSFESLTNT